MNNKTITKFGFRIVWRIMEISEGVIRLGLRNEQKQKKCKNKVKKNNNNKQCSIDQYYLIVLT